MKNHSTRIPKTATLLFVMILTGVGCSGGSFTTREKGAGIGALGGAATGGLIGAAAAIPAQEPPSVAP